MSLTREIIIAEFQVSFGKQAETVYANLRDDYVAQLPNTSLFSKRSVHQAIVSLVESATKHKPNEALAKYWNGMYAEFIKRNPNKGGLESQPLEERQILSAMSDEEADAFKAEVAQVEQAREAKSAEAQAKYAAAAAALLSTPSGEAEKEEDIPF